MTTSSKSAPGPETGLAPIAAATVVVDDVRDGARVDRAVVGLVGLPTAVVRRLCDDGRVTRNGRRAKAGDRVVVGDELHVTAIHWLVPGGTPPPLLFVDDDVLIVDKPAGVACHPIVPGEADTVVDAVAVLHPEIATASPELREAGLVHRLDTGTSGCLAIARHREAWTTLRAAVSTAKKTYLAIVSGAPAAQVIDEPIGHDQSDRRKMRTNVDNGQPATTGVSVLARGRSASLLRLELSGGRRHQLRVHLASIGHPLLGDDLYAGGDGPFFLHAWQLGIAGRPTVTAPIPAAFAEKAA
ncbi:MAG TPA: RluA family pseudouridine synthase, partial [Myxococcota bacterium]